MIISSAKKTIFVHIPKCAGTSFRTAIQHMHDYPVEFWNFAYSDYFQRDLDFAHLRMWEVAAMFPDVFEKLQTYKSLVFVRNRYSRFVSAAQEHISRFGGIKLATRTPEDQKRVIELLIKRNLTTTRILGDKAYVHFSPQAWYINLGPKRIVKHIVPMREGSDFIKTALTMLGAKSLPARTLNESKLAVNEILSSPVVQEFVESFYKQDAILFESLGLSDLAEMPYETEEPEAVSAPPVLSIVS